MKLKAPLSSSSRQQLIETVKFHRAEEKKLRKKLEQEINNKAVKVDDELSLDILNIMENHNKEVTPFMRLFWEQQQKYAATNKSGVRYHPISLASKSASTYDELRESNILTLPSRRTLRDYKNAIKPHAGFNPAIIHNLARMASKLEPYQKYVVKI